VTLMNVKYPSALVLSMVCIVSIAACRPPRGNEGTGDGDGGPDAATGTDGDADSDSDSDGVGPTCDNPVPEICNNGVDDDCDGLFNCADDDCDDDEICASSVCGELERPEGSLELPDGACPEDEDEPCEGYESSITFSGFSPGQELGLIDDLLGICVNMEHSWIRDLVIYAECPSGVRVMLHDFAGRDGGEVFAGVPVDFDGTDPEPGTGWDYCWAPNAEWASWIEYANDTGCETLPAGDYQSSEDMAAFVGCPLNGDWTLRVEDRWGADNGFVFSWSVSFDPALVEDCSVW